MITPDNSAALHANTTIEAMALSIYNCARGDDTPCVSLFGIGACCFMAEVEEVPEQTEDQKPYVLDSAMNGWPTAKGEYNTFCMHPLLVVNYSAYTSDNENA